MRRLLAVAAASFIALCASAQNSSTINVHVVELPVSVLDASGNPVRGLTAANFALYDEKKKQAISSFDAIDFAADAPASAISPMNPAGRRSFILLFDLGFTSPRSMSRAQDAARRFVTESTGPRDLVAVATVNPDRGYRFITALTTDRQLVASAIANPSTFHGSDPLQLANQTVIWSGPQGAESPGSAPLIESSGHAADADQHLRDLAASATAQNEVAVRQRIEREIDSLGNLARSLRMVAGRKQVVLLSEGFDPRLLQGFDARGSKEQTKLNTQIVAGNLEKIDTDKMYGNTAAMTRVQRMADSFRAADVVLHAIDVQGVRVQNNLDEGSIINSNASLFLVSRPTGGEVFENSNDLHSDFERLLRQQEVVYVLGFHTSDNVPGTFHNVSVKLVNVPPGSRAVHAAGYYERGRVTSVDRALTNAQIIINDLPQTDLRVNVLATAFPPSGGKPAQVPVIIDINGADLMRETGTVIGGADVFIYAFDTAGVVRDRLYDRVTIEVAKVGEKVRTTGIRYYGTLMLPPGSYAVKALIRTGDPELGASEALEKRGYARVNINVPAEGQIAILPPIPIDEDGKWLLVRSNRADNADYPFEYGGRTFSPTATADMSAGPRKVALFIFGARPADLTFETRPRTNVLGVTESNGVTKAILQIEAADGANTLDVTVFKKGIAASQHISVPLL
ncbi:MAG: VWA domain-containing protein [Acidobacteria bacterium]|nr:VWA domain-containing protein [Acidobacteriota bacterium]MBV9068814.1 VWA domain-containing protein [Acidobacteriota bacterium]MBV9187334.1 VWA domain-containing protein [Acidobacteriota bacterium]